MENIDIIQGSRLGNRLYGSPNYIWSTFEAPAIAVSSKGVSSKRVQAKQVFVLLTDIVLNRFSLYGIGFPNIESMESAIKRTSFDMDSEDVVSITIYNKKDEVFSMSATGVNSCKLRLQYKIEGSELVIRVPEEMIPQSVHTCMDYHSAWCHTGILVKVVSFDTDSKYAAELIINDNHKDAVKPLIEYISRLGNSKFVYDRDIDQSLLPNIQSQRLWPL